MRAAYYRAHSENGDGIDDPSEDALFMLIDDLNNEDNTFVVIQSDEDDPAWFTSVAVLDEGGYEVVRRDSTRREHGVSTNTSIDQIARDLTIWMAARDFPERPTQSTSDFQNTP
ncbi:hypothetical protein [Streptomyces sp. NBC_01445]|uniref:hypothetical protein n=1 Tax=Streptomyces sp. NBC_01445 TaxID=2903869 RepID=UPI002DDB02B7|nr:hypothetical protein [Streptomyces sp. NBC_01445]WSE10524.1 hypothetical protein OG574_11370 [Streptomyces sp. NBC_01445]